MARHHFVPQFLLRRWANGGRFIAYYFEAAADRVIENPKASVSSALGIGLDEGAAAIVRQNTPVIGENRVLITDGATHDGRPFYTLRANDRYDLYSRRRL